MVNAALAREAEDRRNLAYMLATAFHEPKELDKLVPAPKKPTTEAQETVSEKWWGDDA